jgi:hypothetical protein
LLRVPVVAMERRLEHADLNNLMVAHGHRQVAGMIDQLEKERAPPSRRP